MVKMLSQGVKELEAGNPHGFARIKTKDLSVPIRGDPWPEPGFFHVAQPFTA